MALKPERSKGSDPELLGAVESVADIIEDQINIYAKEQYGNRFILERFTEIDWNVHEKTSIFSRPDRLLFKVSFHRQPPHVRPSGYYLMVTFPNLSLEKSKEMTDAVHFCEKLFNFTHLLVRPWAGRTEFGWKNFL